MTITLIIVVITVLVSLAAFSDAGILNKLIFWPRVMQERPAEYYRFLTSGFIHGDWNHLIFNMLTLFFFGKSVEDILLYLSRAGASYYLFMYLSAIIIAGVPAYIKYRNNAYYRALGASGGVSAIVAFYIYYAPWASIYFYFIPIGIPAILYGLAYVIYSAVMARRGSGNIGHDAHLWGTVYGFIFAFVTDPSHGQVFFYQITHPTFKM